MLGLGAGPERKRKPEPPANLGSAGRAEWRTIQRKRELGAYIARGWRGTKSETELKPWKDLAEKIEQQQVFHGNKADLSFLEDIRLPADAEAFIAAAFQDPVDAMYWRRAVLEGFLLELSTPAREF